MNQRILVVEDDPATRYLYARVLADAGYAVRKARSYVAAAAAIAHEDVDLVVLDLNLPGRNGLEIVDAFRAEPALARIPILIVSGFLEPADRDRALQAGCVDAVRKPSDPADLVALVRRTLAAPGGPPGPPPPA